MERLLLPFKKLLKNLIAMSAWQLLLFIGFYSARESQIRFNFSGSVSFNNPLMKELNNVLKINLIHIK